MSPTKEQPREVLQPVTEVSIPPEAPCRREEGEKQVMIIEDIDLFSCPVCHELLRSNVYQCDNGHLACGACCSFVRNKCPTCSLPIGFTRNRAIESIIESAKIPCKNLQYGCQEKVVCLSAEYHEWICKYSPCRCPCCDFVALPKILYKHFDEEHDEVPGKIISFNSPISYLMFPGSEHTERGFLQEKDERILFVLNRVDHEPLGSLINVICIAPRSSDMEFSYKLTATAGGKSASVTTLVELTPELTRQAPNNNFLLVTRDIYDSLEGEALLKLELTIQKLT